MQDSLRTSSEGSRLTELGRTDLANRRRNLRLVLLYKLVHIEAAMLTNEVSIKFALRDLGTDHSQKLQPLKTSTTECTHYFVQRTILTWNLDTEVDEVSSADTFKSSLAKLEVPYAIKRKPPSA